jgi:hypothetical protein
MSTVRTIVSLLHKYNASATLAFKSPKWKWRDYISKLVIEHDREVIRERLSQTNFGLIARELYEAGYFAHGSATHHHRLTDVMAARTYAKLRSGAHSLEINALRAQEVPREQRFCTLCAREPFSTQELGDETHFLLDCPSLADERKQALLSLQHEITNVKGGKKLWKWYEDLPTKYEKTLALLGKLPLKSMNAHLYTWYITAAKGLNKMYQQKLKLSNMKT